MAALGSPLFCPVESRVDLTELGSMTQRGCHVNASCLGFSTVGHACINGSCNTEGEWRKGGCVKKGNGWCLGIGGGGGGRFLLHWVCEAVRLLIVFAVAPSSCLYVQGAVAQLLLMFAGGTAPA